MYDLGASKRRKSLVIDYGCVIFRILLPKSMMSVLGVLPIPVLFMFAFRTPVHFGVVWREAIHLVIPSSALAHRDLPTAVWFIHGEPRFGVAWYSSTRTPNNRMERNAARRWLFDGRSVTHSHRLFASHGSCRALFAPQDTTLLARVTDKPCRNLVLLSNINVSHGQKLIIRNLVALGAR